MVVSPQALLAVVEVKATLNETQFVKALDKQIVPAFDRIGYARDRDEGYPGFVLGYAGMTDPVRRFPERRLAGRLMGYLDVENDWCRVRRDRWWVHSPNGFAYWYWRLLDALYKGAAASAPLPEGYSEGTVAFDD